MKHRKYFYHYAFLLFIGSLSIGLMQSCQKENIQDESITATPGIYDVSIQVDEMERWFKAIIPSNYDHSKQHPLLLVFHGGNNSMGSFFNKRKDIIERCELENWILVFANGSNGFTNKGSSTWNAIHCCDPSLKHDVDEISFVRKMIDTLEMVLTIDSKKIYALGGSNGGMLVHRIAGEMPDIIAAAASNQATIGGSLDASSPEMRVKASGYIPKIMIHGLNDQKVKYSGGKTLETDRIDISFKETVMFWANNNDCNLSNVDTSVVAGRDGQVWIIDFDNCASNTKVRAITIENRGHGWPSYEDSGYDGTNASIDFLKAFSK